MQINDILTQMGGLDAMAKQLGISETQARGGAEALVPALLGGYKKQVQAQPTGLDGLGSLLELLGGEKLEQEVVKPQPTDVSLGNNVLSQIFGSKDVSRGVAQNAAEKTGLDASVLKQMLPILAMLVTSYMAKQSHARQDDTQSSGGLGGLLGGLLGGAQSAGSQGGLMSILDFDGNGNPLDDIMRIAGKAIR